MSQHDFDIANQGFADFRADLNNALRALGSLSSGDTAPATPYANQLWYETDTNTLHIRNEANSAWLDLMVIDQSTGSPSFTGQTTFADGSASSPSISNIGDTNAGIFFPAADTVAFSTDGTERARIDSAGNLGLGVTPSAWGSGNKAFQLGTGSIATTSLADVNNNTFLMNGAYFDGSSYRYVASSFPATRYVANSGAHSWSTAPSGTAGNAITFTQAMTLDASGNLGLGTTSPNEKVTIASSGSASYVQICDSSTGTTSGDGLFLGSFNGAAELKNKENNILAFGTNNTERARIDASGNLLVRTTSNPDGGVLVVNQDASTNNVGISTVTSSTSNRFHLLFRNGNGQVGGILTSGSTTAYNTSSDYRLKENVQPMQDALAVVAQLNPVTYTWKADGSSGQGFIAHELQAVVPDCVSGEKDAVDAEGNPMYQGVDTSFLVATLVKAIQELKAEVDSLRAQLNP